MIVFGAETMQALVSRLPSRLEAALPRPTLEGAVALAFVTGLLWIVAAAAQMSGDGSGLSIPSAITAMLRETFFGHVAIARLALIAILFPLLRAKALGPARVGVSGLALSAIALTSHAAAAGDPAFLFVRAAVDAVHLLAAGFWAGGLVLLLFLMLRHRMPTGAVLPALRLFSFWAILAVAALVAAGSLNGYFVLFGAHARWSPTYLGLLTAKIVLAALMVSLALANRFSLLPEIAAGKTEAQETLFASTVAELVVGALIVAIIGFLGILSPFL